MLLSTPVLAVAAVLAVALLVPVDQAIFDWASPAGALPALHRMAFAFSEGFQHTWPLLGLLAIAVAPRGRRLRFALVVLTVFAAQAALAELLKHLIGRPRPPDAAEVAGFFHPFSRYRSMPSGHAAGAFAFAALLAALYPRGTWAFGLWAALIALSRLVLGRHYVSDILAGAFLGILVARAVLALLWRDESAPGGAESRVSAGGPGDCGVP